MKPKVKFVLLTFLKSLISNDAAIEGAKQAPWWMALVLGLVSVGLPLIPTAVTTANTKGSQYLSSYSDGQEVALTSLLKEVKATGYEFRVEDGTCLMYKDDTLVFNTYEDSQKPIVTYESERQKTITINDSKIMDTKKTKEVEMMLMYTADSEKIDNYIETVREKYTYVAGEETPTLKEDFDDSGKEPGEIKYYVPSMVIIHKTGLYICLNQLGTDYVFGCTSFVSDWTHTEKCELVERLLANDDIEASKQVITNRAYVDSVYNNLRGVVNETYETAKGKTLLRSTLIFLGVYVVLVILMGLMLFLLTRGKNNPFNYLNFGVTLKMACWAAFTPSVLGMALGFWLTQFAPYIFIALIGIRVMWMSLRSLRPYQ